MTDPALRLLDGVAWRGQPLPGDRLGALLAALALAPGGVSDAGLADEVWADDAPAHPHKALQVLVSRLRARTDAGAKTAVTARQPSTAHPTSEVTWPLLARSRTAEMTWDLRRFHAGRRRVR